MKFRIESEKLKRFSLGLIGMGLVTLLIVWFMLSGDASFRENGEETTAIVTEIDVTTRRSKYGQKRIRRSVYAQYTVDGVTYNERLAGYYNGMSEGQQITVIYDPENPSSVRGENYSSINHTLVHASIVITLVGGVLALVAFRPGGSTTVKYNARTGIPVVAEIISVTMDTSKKIKGRHPYKALCRYNNEATGESFLYNSDSVEQNIARLKGYNVLVYVDSSDKDKYYVDLDSAVPAAEKEQI